MCGGLRQPPGLITLGTVCPGGAAQGATVQKNLRTAVVGARLLTGWEGDMGAWPGRGGAVTKPRPDHADRHHGDAALARPGEGPRLGPRGGWSQVWCRNSAGVILARMCRWGRGLGLCRWGGTCTSFPTRSPPTHTHSSWDRDPARTPRLQSPEHAGAPTSGLPHPVGPLDALASWPGLCSQGLGHASH